MKFKQKISLFIAIIIIFTSISNFTVSAVKVGDKLGNVLNTDIKVYINNYQIPGYAVNNKMCVIMEDLANYGFDVKYDDRARTLTAVRNYEKNITPIKNIADNNKKIGSIAFSYVYTDITVYLYNKKINSFAINGSIVIYIDDLSDYGAFTWNGKTRELNLKLFERSRIAIDPTAKGKEKTAEEVRKLIYKYSPGSTYIFDSVSQSTKSPVNDLISLWYRGEDVFYTLSVVSHETCHMFTGGVTEYEAIDDGIFYINKNYEYDINNNMIYIEKYMIGNPFIVKHPDQKIKTETAAARIPKNLRSLRWGTYVSAGSKVSANVNGVYGLLDELHAYYYGCKAVIDCGEFLAEYLSDTGYSEDVVTGYFSSFMSARLAFYEFKYWTLEYLLYVKEYHPDQYKTIMGNNNYKQAFIYIHDNFEKLVENIIPENNKIIIDKLNEMNIISAENNEAVWFGKSGIGKFTDEIELLKKEISSAKYTDMLKELRK